MRRLLQTKRRGVFFGWWIVVGGMVAIALQTGVLYYGFSAFFVPLIAEFGWSRAALSGAFSLAHLESGIAGPLVGFVIDRFGTRIPILAGSAIACLTFILLSQVNSITMFYALFLLLSAGSSLAFGSPVIATVAKWFIKRRSLAMGILMCGAGLAGLIVTLLTWLIGQYGWRTTMILCGIVFLANGIPLAWLMRPRPEPYGYLPDGNRPDSGGGEVAIRNEPARGHNRVHQGAAAQSVGCETLVEPTFSARQALATSAFWMLSLAVAVRMLGSGAIAVHLIPALMQIGFSPESAASVLAGMSLASIPGRLIYGWLGDRYDKRRLFAVAMFQQALAFAALAYASDLTLVIVFAALYGPGYGASTPLQQSIVGEYFGRKYFATISGLCGAVFQVGIIAAPIMAGYTFDVTNSYQFAFLFFVVSNLVGMVLIVAMRKPSTSLLMRERRWRRS